MSNEDQTKWIGLTWGPADKVPAEAKQELRSGWTASLTPDAH